MAVYSVDTVIPTEDEECAECQKCGLLQGIEKWIPNLSAQFTIKATNGEQRSFYAYNEMVANIAERAPYEVTKIAILKSGPFCLQYNKKSSISSQQLAAFEYTQNLIKTASYMISIINIYACVWLHDK